MNIIFIYLLDDSLLGSLERDMIFNKGYYSPMDREYEIINTLSSSPEKNIGAPLLGESPKVTKLGLGPKELGTSVLMRESGAQSLQSRIFHGANKIELAFLGTGKGHKEALTPESFTKEEREAMRQLARINKVETTVHAAVGLAGISGLSEGKFDDVTREQSVHEIKRAIDFAADATTGGAVVFHTAEFPRPVSEVGPLEMYPGEKWEWKDGKRVPKKETKVPIYLADSKTGKIMSIPNDQKFYLAERDPQSGELLLDKETSQPKMTPMTYDEIVAKERKDPKNSGKTDHALFLSHFYDQQLAMEEGEALRRVAELRKMKEELVELEKMKNFIDKNFPLTEESKKDEWRSYFAGVFGEQAYRKPVDELKKLPEQAVRELQLGIKAREDIISSHYQKAIELREQVKNYDTIENIGVMKAAESVAEAAVYAMKRTEAANRKLQEKKETPISPIYISPENLFPETYGSHPDELKKLIRESREKMKEHLMQQGYDEKSALGKARDHIKATFDIGHMNIWRKYWADDPKKSLEENENDFRKWLLDKVQDLVKSDVVGHIHLGDNFGFHDEHLEIGKGTAPIKEFLEMAKKAGVTDIIVEPGSTNFERIWPEALAELGSPIYAAGTRIPYNNPVLFDQIRHQYHGNMISPYYVVEPYAPSEDWRNWSSIGFE